jgi:hypothetical protein
MSLKTMLRISLAAFAILSARSDSQSAKFGYEVPSIGGMDVIAGKSYTFSQCLEIAGWATMEGLKKQSAFVSGDVAYILGDCHFLFAKELAKLAHSGQDGKAFAVYDSQEAATYEYITRLELAVERLPPQYQQQILDELRAPRQDGSTDRPFRLSLLLHEAGGKQ